MSRPNIVFILLDDFGWTDLACYGSDFYETPNIDRFCSQGMRFTDAYASCPVCSPTRASVMTGKYPANVGITDWIDWVGKIHPSRGRVIDVPYLKDLPTSEVTIAHALKEGGYATWHVGKWHLGGEGHLPHQVGFDVNIGGCEAGCPLGRGYFSPWSIPALKDVDVPEGTYLTDYLTDCAVALINEHPRGTPFYLNLDYYTVHTPIQAKPEKIEKFQHKAENLGLTQLKTFEDGDFFPITWKKGKRIRRRLLQSDPVYAGMIESMDEGVGRILDALDRQGIAENTVVIFTSDNGGCATSEGSPTCNAPLSEGKGWMYEGGTREPLIVRWPGKILPGSTCDVPVTTPDFYPTMLEIAALPLRPEQHQDGVSLLRLLTGQVGDLDREAIFWHYPHYGNQGGTPGCSVRSGDYKLIEFFEDGSLELYNLREDISEESNLSEALPDIRDRLHNMLVSWRESVEAKIPQPNPDFVPWREADLSK